jgi:hypothetical protein
MIPVAQVLSLDSEPGLTRYDVMCPYCDRIHHHQWLGGDTAFTVLAPCSPAGSSDRYRVFLPKNFVTRCNTRSLSTSALRPAAVGRDDNAINEVPHLWEE